MKKIRGMKDYLSKDMDLFYNITNICINIFNSYGFNPINTPLLEPTELFIRSLGTISDIVKKEMYTFFDLNNKSISLRPEGTASCVRAVIENKLYKNNPCIKYWYFGPMFRYERPQKCRYRQFYQIGAEVFGQDNTYVETELILLIQRIFTSIHIDKNKLILHINSIGDNNSRDNYKQILKEYLKKYYLSLNKNIQHIIDYNTLRIFDSKDTTVKDILLDAPKITDYLEEKDLIKFNNLINSLKELNIDFVIDKTLVRGLDYYSGNVFEWKTNDANDDLTICAGGRYDNLVQLIHYNHGLKLPAVGFALGIERLIMYINKFNLNKQNTIRLYKIYFVILEDSLKSKAFIIAEYIRDKLLFKNIQIILNNNYKSLKKQFAYANKSKIDVVIILGPEEIKKNLLTVKNLSQGIQYHIKIDELINKLTDILLNI